MSSGYLSTDLSSDEKGQDKRKQKVIIIVRMFLGGIGCMTPSNCISRGCPVITVYLHYRVSSNNCISTGCPLTTVYLQGVQ